MKRASRSNSNVLNFKDIMFNLFVIMLPILFTKCYAVKPCCYKI